MDPIQTPARGRPGLSEEVVGRIATMARDGITPTDALAELTASGTKVSATKLYEIYRQERRAASP